MYLNNPCFPVYVLFLIFTTYYGGTLFTAADSSFVRPPSPECSQVQQSELATMFRKETPSWSFLDLALRGSLDGVADLNHYLCHARSTLSFLEQDLVDDNPAFPNVTLYIVLGNSAADLDSMVSSIMYGWFRQGLNPSALFVPVINIARRRLRLRQDIVSMFSNLGVAVPWLIFRDEVDLYRLAEHLSGNLRLILVDHNRLSPALESLQKHVDAVLDHHMDEKRVDLTRAGGPVIIQPVGSAASLVALEMLKYTLIADPGASILSGSKQTVLELDGDIVDQNASEFATTLEPSINNELPEGLPIGPRLPLNDENATETHEEDIATRMTLRTDSTNVTLLTRTIFEGSTFLNSMDASLGTLLLGPIVVDTRNFAPSLARDADQQASSWLFSFFQNIDTDPFRNALYTGLQNARLDIAGLSGKDLLRRDYKEYDLSSGIRFGISTIPVPLQALLAGHFHPLLEKRLEKRRIALGIVVSNREDPVCLAPGARRANEMLLYTRSTNSQHVKLLSNLAGHLLASANIGDSGHGTRLDSKWGELQTILLWLPGKPAAVAGAEERTWSRKILQREVYDFLASYVVE